MRKTMLLIAAALVCVSAFVLFSGSDGAEAEVSDDSGSCGETASNGESAKQTFKMTLILWDGKTSEMWFTGGGIMTIPPDPERTGYTFLYWFKDDYEYVFPEIMPTEDLTLEAVWKINKYTISFDTDGGSSVPEITKYFGTEIFAPNDPTKTGYKFCYWTEDGMFSYDFPDTMPGENVRLKAVWSIGEYTISFLSYGGTYVPNITKKFGSEISAPNDPTRTGYTFRYWEGEDGNEFVFETMPGENHTLTAVWDANPYGYTVKYQDGNGNTLADDVTGTADFGTEVDAELKEITGYTAPSAAKIRITEIADNNVKVYVYTINSYDVTVKYVYSDGSTAADTEIVSVNYKEDYRVDSPAITGYTADKTAVSGTMGAGDVSETVIYTINSYDVSATYVYSDGSKADETKTTSVEYGKPYNVETPAVVGYTADKAAVSGTMGADDVAVTVTYTVNTYTITFDTDGGVPAVDAITKDYGTSVTAPGSPTKTGYTFQYWTQDGKTGYSFPETMPAEDIALKAVWKANAYTVSFSVDGKEVSAGKYDYDTPVKNISAPADPSKDADAKYSYTFAGWDGYTDDVKISGDTVFKAVFAAKEVSGSAYTIEAEKQTVSVSDSVVEVAKRSAATDATTVLKVTAGKSTVVFDSVALQSVTAGELKVSELSEEEKTDLKEEIGDSPVYSISFGTNTSFGNGTATVTVPYAPKEGQGTNNLEVWYLKDGKVVEKLSATYENGAVTFVTGHFSDYAVVYVESEEECSSMMMIAIIAIIVIVAVAGAVIVKKRKA